MADRHRILIDSGFGSYAIGRKPHAAGNAFLYNESSLILWTDEILCDQNALEGEKEFAEEGWLASQLFVRLEEEGLVRGAQFDPLFHEGVVQLLEETSNNDFKDARQMGHIPTSTIEPERIKQFNHNGFYDINALLFLSQYLGCPFIDVMQTAEYYTWKLNRVASQSGYRNQPDYRSREVLQEVFDFFVPSFQLCPKNNEVFSEAQEASNKLFECSEAWARGDVDESTYRKQYAAFEEKWRRYDDLVRSEALEGLDVLLDLRRDSRLEKLRALAGKLSESVTTPTDDSSFSKDIEIELTKEILEVQREIANVSKFANYLDKFASYLSPTLQVGSVIGGATGSAVTSDPIFAVAGLLPSAMKWANEKIREGLKRQRAWYFYMRDVRDKIEKEMGISMMENKLKKLEQVDSDSN